MGLWRKSAPLFPKEKLSVWRKTIPAHPIFNEKVGAERVGAESQLEGLSNILTHLMVFQSDNPGLSLVPRTLPSAADRGMFLLNAVNQNNWTYFAVSYLIKSDIIHGASVHT